MALQHLFVYGSLAPNRVNHHIMTPITEGQWQPATIRGYMLADGGWGSAMGYPAVIPNDNGEIVQGYVFSSEDLVNHWQRLDEFEGEGYQRVEVTAMLSSGQPITAFTYAFNSRQNY